MGIAEKHCEMCWSQRLHGKRDEQGALRLPPSIGGKLLERRREDAPFVITEELPVELRQLIAFWGLVRSCRRSGSR